MKKVLPLARAFKKNVALNFHSSSLQVAKVKKLFISTALSLAILLMGLNHAAKAQLIVVYDFNSATVTAAPIGYAQPNAGTYYRNAAGSNITFGTQSCDGFSKSAPTSSSLFHFVAVKDLRKITIRAYTGSSNRVLNSFSTSATLNGTYTNVANTNTSSLTASGTCGEIVVTPTAPIPAGTFMRFNLSGNIDITSIVLDFIPTGTPPTITTDNITPGQNTATIFGTVTPGTMPLHSSGVIWSTVNTPMDITLATKTINEPSATGAFNNLVSGLTPATAYFGRAYVKDLAGNVYYGAIIPFQTAAATAPTLNTVNPYNILTHQATSGGNAIDSGGLTISQKGIVWSTTPAPTTALTTKTTEGIHGNNFTSLARVLTPNTTYFVRAYATNAAGTGYGNEVSFTTPAPVPVLIANPLTLNFGQVPFNSTSPVFNYMLNGNNLSPASGSVVITAPAGYTLSTSSNTGFVNQLTLNYTAGTITNRIIYVKFSTATYGSYCGNITHSGGGTIPANTDTVKACGAIIPDPSVTTNLGTDFWTGFGYTERQDRKAGDANEAKMSIYVSVPVGSQPATVTIELPGIPGAAGFPKSGLTVAPGSVIEVKDFPTGDPGNNLNPNKLPDSRLYYTGVSSRGVHIYSTNGVPIAVWMHTYAPNNSAAGAMIFPTNTWNNAYTVQAFGGQPNASPYQGGFTNNSNPNSFFFVVAEEDNTPIWFTPSQDVLDSSSATLFSEGHAPSNVKYAKNVEHGPIYLNRGQVFNAMGFIQGTGSSANGLDLSGSKVRTDCTKKIAVFGGNGRCLVNSTNCSASSGSDHMIQQMFPSVAWGTKYITVPTKTMEFNMYRITVSDPTTRVWVNNPAHTTPLTGLVNNLYYQLHGRSTLLIESDKPINVTQFIVAGQCNTSQGGKGDGDPEMIILSPVQQAINNATVYSAAIKKSDGGANGHYINVVIRKGGIPSFRLDGAATADTGINQAIANAGTCYNTGGIIPIANAFVKHPFDTNYYVAKFRVTPGAAHRLYSDSTFNAMAYGMGSGESYGYSAGTNIKDLTKPLLIDNPYSENATNTSCINNPIRLKAVLPYPPALVSKIDWFMSKVIGLNRQDTTINNPIPDSTYDVDGTTYYVYTNPNYYVFPSAGTYRITGLVTGTFASACGSTAPLDFTITVVGDADLFPDFTFDYNGCISDTVKFKDVSVTPQYPAVKWLWSFGDNKTDTVQNPAHVYNPTGIYNIKLRVVNSIGCYADTTKEIDQTMDIIANFGVADTICAKSTVTFFDSSIATAPIVKWLWNFGDGRKDSTTSSTNPTHTYANAGSYDVTLTVFNAAGCSHSFTKTIIIRPIPVASFQMPSGICLPSGITQFTNLSTLTPTGPFTSGWTFGDGGVSNQLNPVHTYSSTGPFTIVLTVTSSFGCQKDTTQVLSTVYAQPTALIGVAAENCLGDTTSFTDNSNGQGHPIVKWYWNFGDGKTDTVKNPKHVYTTAGSYTVALVVTTDKGCLSDTIKTPVTINALPVANFNVSPLTCVQQAITFTDQSTPVTGTTLTNWGWNMGNGNVYANSNNNPVVENYATAGTFNVRLQVTDSKGCKKDTTKPVTINPKPRAGFTISKTCDKDAFTQFTDTSSISNGTQASFTYAWNFGDANSTPGNPNTSTIKDPRHTYALVGSYNVSLIVTSNSGCIDSVKKPATVNPLPVANFDVPVGICLPEGKAQFFDRSTITDGSASQFTYSWNFGNPVNTTPSTAKNPVHNYSTTGPFNIRLTVTSKDGCSKDTTKTLSTIFPKPTASFTPSDDEVCLGEDITFTDNSNGISSAVVKWNWTFDDGQIDSTKDVSHTYTRSGMYNVKLAIINANGCVADTTIALVVHSLPTVDGGPTVFVQQASPIVLQPIVTGNIISYQWTPSLFLDYDTIKNPVSTPLNDIRYHLLVIGQGGCIAEDTLRVNLYRKPLIPNVFSPNGDGINDKWIVGYLETYPRAVVEVFDRYGQRVYAINGSNNRPWDGTNKGNPLPVGTYYYLINLNIGTPPISGHVTILK